MDLSFTADEVAFRDECRTWLEANVPQGLPSGDTREGFALHLDWERALFAARWAVVSWPEQYGGRGASPMEWLIFEEEYYRAGGPQRVTQNGIFLLAPTVFAFGTKEQQDRILPRMAAAEDLWCQGWSEPNAGSDLAGIQARAVRDEPAGGWRLSGQKTWTTRGAFCTHLFGLFRSDPDAERHRGLTYLLVPLDAPGVTVRGFGRLDGDEGFAEVFLDDVFVPDDGVLGDVHQGWRVAMATTSAERGLTLRSPGRFMAAAVRLVDLWRARGADVGDQRRDDVVRAWIDAEAYRWQTFLTVTRMTDGEELGAESSLTKVFWSELDVRLHETALEILGTDAERDVSGWAKAYEFALSGPIYAGTNEIQRNVIAERVLGLPRVGDPMRFAFDDEQLAFRDAVRDLLAKECTPETVRAAWSEGRTGSAWSLLADMGVLGVLAPESADGLGLGPVDLVLLLEESGYAALPEPIVEHACVAMPLFDAPRSGVLDGTEVITAPFHHDAVVPYADRADWFLLLADRAFRLVARDAVSVEPCASVDGARHLARVVWDDAGGDVVAEGDAAAQTFDRGAFGTAAQLVGLARRMIDMTVEYTRERRQFGVPIGSFQAVKHHLADARLALEFARPLVYRAAWSLAECDADASTHVSMAKATASDAATLAARKALQCHGAIGYSFEYDLQLFMKRSWALAAAWGDAAWHRDRVGRAIL